MTTTNTLLQEAWIKAAAKPGGARIECGTKQAAQQFRLRLYRAVAEVRKDPSSDPRLAEAVSAVNVSFDPQDRSVLWLRRGVENALMQQLAEQLDIKTDELEDSETRAMRESSERLLKNLEQQTEGYEQPPEPTKRTKYY
jgi:hypothetical protein